MPDITDVQRQAVRNVVDFYLSDEIKDAKEYQADNGSLEGHVLCDLVTLENLLDGGDRDPADYVADPE